MELSTEPGHATMQPLADCFEKAWEKVADPKDAPDLESFLLAPEDSGRIESLHELIPIDLAKRWQRHQPIGLEQYLERFPEIRSTPKLLPQLLFAEYRVRHEYGDKPHPALYQERFPEQFTEVERLIEEQAYKTLPAPPSAPTTLPVDTPKPASSAARDRRLPVGEGYRLLKRIGSGSYGEVWRAEAPGDIEVAIKIIFRPIDHAEAQRELQALELIKRLRHPYLVHTQAYWPLEDRLYIVMELADGSLSGRLKECQQAGLPGIPADELLGYFREAAEALDYLHSEHVQHRDIKPDNILLLQRHAKVADFGMARLQGGIPLVNATTCGTPAYMAPEVWQGKISTHSDQYSLAMTYIELRLGRSPYPARDMVQMMFSHVKEQPDIATLDEAEQRVLLKAVAKDPDERYLSCRAFAEALGQALSKEERETRPEPQPQRLGWRWLFLAGALVLLLAFVGYRALFPPESLSRSAKLEAPPIHLPAGAEKLSDEILSDQNSTQYYKSIACRLPGDNEPIEFVLVPKRAREDPDTFYIMKNKVSVGLYRKFADAHPELAPRKEWNPQHLGDDYPALGVGVEDAYHFAQYLHGNLPTRKEWDKAAGRYLPDRGEGPYKGTWTAKSKLRIAVNRQPMPVGKAEDDESPYGCRDMAGNGFEWTRDVDHGRQVPIADAKGEGVHLRGQGYEAPHPLRYRDLEQAGGAVKTALWPYQDPNEEIGFRIVIEP
jgi:serine/threonine protein kinase